jgi:acetyl esterase
MAPDPVTQEFLDMLAAGPPRPPLHELPVPEAREMSSGMRAAFPDTFPEPAADVEKRVIPGGPNGDLTTYIVRPPGVGGPLPIVMFFHGGGWVLGDFGTHRRLVHELAVGAGAAVVFPEYSRSPEVRFPVANEEAYFVTKYVAEHAKNLNLDATRMAVAGDSVGANMATVVCILANERGGPKISGAVLFFPVTNADFDTATYKQFAEGYFLTRDSMQWMWDNYAPGDTRRNPLASILQLGDDRLRAMPPTFLLTCEFDVLRDEGEWFAHKLLAAGVPVTAMRALGAIHACVSLGPLANTPPVRTAIMSAVAHLRRTLE